MNSSLCRFTFFLVFAVLFFSCTKIVTTDIGTGLIPPVDGVITKDTVLQITTKNAGYDSTSVGISDNHVLGYVNDAVFGTTTASLNFQVAPPYADFSWGIDKSNVVLDSVVLCFAYRGVWGDTTQPLRVHVYTMDPEVVFANDSSYKNTRTFEKGPEISEFSSGTTIYPTTLDDIDTTEGFYKEVTTNQIRIRLSKTFGQQIVDLDSANAFINDSTFYDYLRGLIVEPETTGHALLQVNLTDTTTHLSFYYHSKDLTDTLTRRFAPNDLTSASSNTILRNYQGTQIPSYIASTDSTDDQIFMQTTPGTYANINISAVLGLPNVIIHRAEILMYQIPDGDNYLTPPNLFLAAYKPDSIYSFAIPNDVTFYGTTISNLTQFGVYPRLNSNTGAYYYSFDVSRYVQGIITRSDTLFNLRLTAPYNQYIYTDQTYTYAVPIAAPSLNTVGIGRIRLGGGNNPQYKMRLHIVYSLPD
jgi:hypothetical protein